MGIIRAAVDTARGTLSDQWLDVVEAGDMGEQTLFTEGNIVRQGSKVKRCSCSHDKAFDLGTRQT